ncbi:hypothetical protein TURU_028549 [Turdus rufiventris]|nr:hypothetical protein TURU_028549 [Turdus rufiventris]
MIEHWAPAYVVSGEESSKNYLDFGWGQSPLPAEVVPCGDQAEPISCLAWKIDTSGAHQSFFPAVPLGCWPGAVLVPGVTMWQEPELGVAATIPDQDQPRGQDCAAKNWPGWRQMSGRICLGMTHNGLCFAVSRQPCCGQKDKNSSSSFVSFPGTLHEGKVRGGAGSQRDSHSAGRDHLVSSDSLIAELGRDQPLNAAELHKNCFN